MRGKRAESRAAAEARRAAMVREADETRAALEAREATRGKAAADGCEAAATRAAAGTEESTITCTAAGRLEAAGALETAKARAAAMAFARALEVKRAMDRDVTPWLRSLRFRAEEVRLAAAYCETIPDAPIEHRVRAAIAFLRPGKPRPVRVCPAAEAAPNLGTPVPNEVLAYAAG